MRTVRVLPLACVAALAAPAVAGAASPAKPSSAKQSSFTVRDSLTPSSELRGTVRFTTPAGWKATAGGGRHSYVRFQVRNGACLIEIHVSVRGKATKRSARQQVPGWNGATAFAHGTRRGGAWGTLGPTFSGGEGEPDVNGLYGTAAVRVKGNRYGQIRIFADLRDCAPDTADAQTLLDPTGRTAKQVNHVLAKAKTALRQQPTSRR